MEAVFSEAGDQGLVGRHDQDRDGIVLRDAAIGDQQFQGCEAATACADFVNASWAFDDDEVLQHTGLPDGCGEFCDAELGRGG